MSFVSLQALFDLLPRLCGVEEEECVRVEDFLNCWGEWPTAERVPLYCENSELRERVRRGAGSDVKPGDDTRSIAHQVRHHDNGQPLILHIYLLSL